MTHTTFFLLALFVLFALLGYGYDYYQRHAKVPPKQQADTMDSILEDAYRSWQSRRQEYADEPPMSPQTAYALGYLDATVESGRIIASRTFGFGPFLLLRRK